MQRKLTDNQVAALRAIEKGDANAPKGVRLSALQDRGLVSKRGVPKLTNAGRKALQP